MDVMLGDVDSWPENEVVRELLFGTYDVVVFSKCLTYLRTKNEIMERLKTKSIIVFDNNPGSLRNRLKGQAEGVMNWKAELPYRLKGGQVIDINGPSAIAKWGASYGYGRSHKLRGGLFSGSLIVKMEADR
jgi:hypothetical protein